MNDLGKLLVILGGILVLAGVAVLLFGKLNLPVGRLPGDFVYRGKNTTVYFPLVTSLLLSVLLSVVFYVIGKMSR